MRKGNRLGTPAHAASTSLPLPIRGREKGRTGDQHRPSNLTHSNRVTKWRLPLPRPPFPYEHRPLPLTQIGAAEGKWDRRDTMGLLSFPGGRGGGKGD